MMGYNNYKHLNEVYLYGKAHALKFKTKNDTDEVRYALGVIQVIQGLRDTYSRVDNVKYDFVPVVAQRPEVIEEMLEWEEGDIVFCKGYISSFPEKKPVKCSHCGGGHDREEGVVMLLFAERKWYRPDDDEAIEILKDHVEISNMCKVAGEVCTDVIMSSIKRRKKEIPIAEYAVIVPVSNDQTRKVWVRTGGKTALSDHEVLRIGSRLLIDGMILSRKNVKRHTICRLCGQMFEWDSIKPMIAAYAIEYLKDFKEFEVEKAGPDQDSDILEADGSVEEEADDQEEGTT